MTRSSRIIHTLDIRGKKMIKKKTGQWKHRDIGPTMGVVLSRLRDSYGLQTPKRLRIHHFACLVHTGVSFPSTYILQLERLTVSVLF